MLKTNKIFRIPESIAVKIAAGEVIERPASVVKELIENAIDAEANSIVVEIIAGGKKSIWVRDNGCGINKDDVKLSLERFTTSKLKISNLPLENIDTMGFRGEALTSIASVSQLAMTTRTDDAETATFVYAEGGKIIEENQLAAPKGTLIEVKNLFYNLPARRKFLKSDKTEESHIESLFLRLTLPHFEKSFTLKADGKKLLDFSKGETLSPRIKKIFPKDSLPTLEFKNKAGNYSIEGILTAQGIDFSTSANIIIYVNGRLIKDRIITHALSEAFRTHISAGRYPGGVIFLTVPLHELDVNVHPAKGEVKFIDPNFIHNFVQKSVQSVLTKGTHFKDEQDYKQSSHDIFTPFSLIAPQRGDQNLESRFEKPEPTERLDFLKKDGYFANLTILGQLKNSYIICGDDRGVIIIDQHAAHERITFENLKRNFSKKSIPIQNLLFPIEFELKEVKGNLLKESLKNFRSFGFIIEEFGKNSFLLRGVPEILINLDHIKIINDILEMMAEFSSDSEKEKKTDEILSAMACHSSVRFARALSHQEIHSLLTEIDNLEALKTCPHGRPFMVSIDESELKKMFKRT